MAPVCYGERVIEGSWCWRGVGGGLVQLIKASQTSTKATSSVTRETGQPQLDVVFALLTHFSPSQNPTLSVYKLKPLTESGYYIFYPQGLLGYIQSQGSTMLKKKSKSVQDLGSSPASAVGFWGWKINTKKQLLVSPWQANRSPQRQQLGAPHPEHMTFSMMKACGTHSRDLEPGTNTAPRDCHTFLSFQRQFGGFFLLLIYNSMLPGPTLSQK